MQKPDKMPDNNMNVCRYTIYLVLWFDIQLLHLLDGKSDSVLIVTRHHDANFLLLSLCLKMFDSVHAIQQTPEGKKDREYASFS